MDTGSLSVYRDFLIVLAVAGIVVPLFVRLGLNAILGFLITGVLLSPSVLGTQSQFFPFLKAFVISDAHGLTSVGELGVVFLLFLIGLELSYERLVRLHRLVFGLGGLQVIVTTALLAGFAILLGASSAQAIFIGAALSLSSTAIVIQLLADSKRTGRLAGRVSFAVLLMQDLAVIPFLMLAGIVGRGAGQSLLLGVGLALIQAATAIVIIVVVGRFGLQPLLRSVAGTHSSDLFMGVVLFIAIGAGTISAYLGLSMGLGGFIAGLTLAETEYRRAIEAILEPFKGLLLGAFFLLVGMSIDFSVLIAAPLQILGIAFGVILLKAILIFILARLMHVPAGPATEVALLLSACGEFAFVILSAAKASKVLDLTLYNWLSLAVTMTMLALPLLFQAARRLGARQTRQDRQGFELPPPEDSRPAVIIAGYGRVGRLVSEMLDEHKVRYVAIDADTSAVAKYHKAGLPVYYGDASNIEFLRRCGIASAKVLAITMDERDAVDAVATAVRRQWHDIRIIARARDERHAMRLYEEGVSEAVPETIEASLQLGEAVLVEAGIAMGPAIASVHERRDSYRKLLGRPNRRAELSALRDRLAINLHEADKNSQR